MRRNPVIELRTGLRRKRFLQQLNEIAAIQSSFAPLKDKVGRA
jgi:hypothetical protein